MPRPEPGSMWWATDGTTRCAIVSEDRRYSRSILLHSLNNLDGFDLVNHTIRPSLAVFEAEWQAQPRISVQWLHTGSIWRPFEMFRGLEDLVIVDRVGNGTIYLAQIPSRRTDFTGDPLDEHGLTRMSSLSFVVTPYQFMQRYARVWSNGQEPNDHDDPHTLYPEMLYRLGMLTRPDAPPPKPKPKRKRKPRSRKPKVKLPPAWYDRLDEDF